MMTNDFTWIGIHLFWIAAWILYKLLIESSRSFVLNRFALYSILLLPFGWFLEGWSSISPVAPSLLGNFIVESGVASLGSKTEQIDWLALGATAYILVAVFHLFRFIFELLKIFRLKAKSRKVEESWGTYYTMEGEGAFCFFNFIFIGEKVVDKEVIYLHESIHAKALHSLDILLLRLMKIVFWLNPFWNLIEKSFKQNHEYFVDEQVLDQVSYKQYVASIVSSGVPTEFYPAGSAIYQVQLIKKRIEMMKRKQTHGIWRSLSFFGLLMAGLILSSNQLIAQNEEVSIAKLDQVPVAAGCENINSDEQLGCFQKAVMNHIIENFKYPEACKKQNITGKTFVSFKISTAGRIYNEKIARSSGNNLLDAESLRLIRSLKDFRKGGMKDGKKVVTAFTIPIAFKL
jgi:TonB family protein